MICPICGARDCTGPCPCQNGFPAVVLYMVQTPDPQSAQPSYTFTSTPSTITPEQIRRIIREELEALERRRRPAQRRKKAH